MGTSTSGVRPRNVSSSGSKAVEEASTILARCANRAKNKVPPVHNQITAMIPADGTLMPWNTASAMQANPPTTGTQGNSGARNGGGGLTLRHRTRIATPWARAKVTRKNKLDAAPAAATSGFLPSNVLKFMEIAIICQVLNRSE